MRDKRIQRPWREELKDMFSIHEGERRGITLLLSFCMAALAWVVFEQWISPGPVGDLARIQVAWKQLDAGKGSSIAAPQRSDRQKPIERVELFKFDPNHLPVEQWVMLGLSERQAAVIHRYEDKGGRFRTKKDLLRMRVIDPQLFARWEPFILLPDSAAARPRTWGGDSLDRSIVAGGAAQRGASGREERSERTRTMLEINSADTNQLIAVPGIGPAFARAIVKYRDRLGGFHDLDQLAEIHLLRDKPEAVARLKERLVVDTLMMHRIPVNSFIPEDLGPHPYAGWKVAKAIAAYRKQHGPFRSIGDIRNCALVTDSLYRKLAPYLSAE